MAGRYRIRFVDAALEHLRAIPRGDHSAIREAVSAGLGDDPQVPTRNRKPLRQPCVFGTAWELRCGSSNRFRVFYEVDDAGWTVWVLAVGEKDGERLWIGGKEVTL